MTQKIKCGDKFVRPEAPDLVWSVQRIVDLPNLPQHAEIVARGQITKTMLLSETALLDHRMWKAYSPEARAA